MKGLKYENAQTSNLNKVLKSSVIARELLWEIEKSVAKVPSEEVSSVSREKAIKIKNQKKNYSLKIVLNLNKLTFWPYTGNGFGKYRWEKTAIYRKRKRCIPYLSHVSKVLKMFCIHCICTSNSKY